MKKYMLFTLICLLFSSLNSFALGKAYQLGAQIDSFNLDPQLNIEPKDGEIIVDKYLVRLKINKIGFGCKAINCTTDVIIEEIFEAPIVEIYKDDCKALHYKSYKSDVLANDQEVYIEVINYENSYCPYFINTSPTEIVLKTTHVINSANQKIYTQSKMTAEPLVIIKP